MSIVANNLSFKRNGEEIIHGFSFSIAEGAYVGVIGPNGGGKTTLLRLMLGLEKPTTGSLRLFDRAPTDRHIRRQIGYVPQRGGNLDPLFPATVEEVIHSVRASESGVRKAVQQLNIKHLLTRPMSHLSGGERQKVLLARALAIEPKILFLDEPVDGLDPKSRDEFYTLLRQLNANGLTIVFVTHDVHAIAEEADSALCLKHQLVCHGHKACHIDREELQNLVHTDKASLREHHH